MVYCSIAPAKLILLGEHFVVMGKPALATAVDLYAKVCIERSDEKWIESSNLGEKTRIDSQGVPEKFRQFQLIAKMVEEMAGVERGFYARINSDIPVSSGLGSSAAVSVAFTHALMGFYGVEPKLEEVNRVAYEAEKVVHGKPSGVDNTVSTYGGLLYYRKGVFKRVDTGVLDECTIVIVDTRIRRDTGQVVRKVLDLISRDDVFEKIYDIAEIIVEKALDAVSKRDLHRLSILINVNHGLLEAIGVTNYETEYAVHRLKELGALASKISGAGLGGVVYGLFNKPIDKSLFKEAFDKKGFGYYIVKPVSTGVKFASI